MTTSDADVLDAAADEVLAGWRQFGYGDHTLNNGNVSALGAIMRSSRLHNVSWFEYAVHLEVHMGISNLSGVFKWNDAPDRTAGEVADAMRSCAKSLREKQ